MARPPLGTSNANYSPSSADIERWIMSAELGDFVISLYLTHPELEMGSPWAADMARAAERCAVDIANRE